MTTSWTDLYRAHARMRETRTEVEDLSAEIRKRLNNLAEMNHCDASSAHRLSYQTTRRARSLRKWYLHPGAEGPDAGIALTNIPGLSNVRLLILALVDSRRQHLHQFTAQVCGTTQDGQEWTVAVHLEEDLDPKEHDRRGLGACSHAAFHCHVGPNLDAEPKVRVPLPAIGVGGALDWVLSLVVPGWEPVPWATVPGNDVTRRKGLTET